MQRCKIVFGPFPSSKVNEIIVAESIQFFLSTIRPKGHLAHILSQVLCFCPVNNKIPFLNCIVSFVSKYINDIGAFILSMSVYLHSSVLSLIRMKEMSVPQASN